MASLPPRETPVTRDTAAFEGCQAPRLVAMPTCAPGTQRFACPSALLAEFAARPWSPIGSALRTQSVLNVSVFCTNG
ncbi:uncharacterized protein BCN122_I1366 [Burkholderia cenocepacia]|nr:uncharacterized protein BCN122_I1366 [Burkholderia cenocepacia]